MVLEYFGTRGGTEEYVRHVGTGLLGRGHRVELCYERPVPIRGAAWDAFATSVKAHRMPVLSADRTRWLVNHVRTTRPHVLFVQNVALTADAVDAIGSEVPIVRFVHDFRPVCMRMSKVFPISRQNCTRALGYGCLLHACSIGPGGEGGLPLKWNSLSERMDDRKACHRMSRVLVASRFMRDLLILNGFEPSQVHAIGLFSPTTVPIELAPAGSPTRLVYVGQVHRFKGLPLLLEALSLTPSSVTLDVAGDGPWRNRCEGMARTLGVAERVRFHGWVEREHLPLLLAQTGLLVFPSVWNEPFGLAGLEAMAFGRPVIAFDVGGVSEWLEDGVTGILVHQLTAGALAAAIGRLCDDAGLAAAMGSRGHQRVREYFTLDHHLSQLETQLQTAGKKGEEAISAPLA